MASFLPRVFGLGPKGLDKYELERVIARGGMSAVWKAHSKTDGDIVAVKLLNPDSVELADRLAQTFGKSEGQIALSLKHPNVVVTYEFGKSGNQYFIVMEYVDGPNLMEMITRHDPRWMSNRMKLIMQIGRGLSYIHSHGLVHRDFCPKNVLIDPSLQAKIIDFGLSIPKSRRQRWRWDRSGTPSYMAPEQVRGQEVDVRTDIYAFGISMFELLTGRKPFRPGRTRYGKMQPHLNVMPAAPSQHDAKIPSELDDIVIKACEKRREQRYQTVDALLRDLQAVVEKLPRGELR